MHATTLAALMAALVVLAGCSATLPVRVLQEGEVRLTASVGGPVAVGTSPVGVIPYTTAGAMYGVSDGVTLHAQTHLMMAAFSILALDAGASARVVRQHGAVPEITFAASVFGFTGFDQRRPPRLYPDVAITSSWDLGDEYLGYAGTHATFDAGSTYVSPYLGIVIPLSNRITISPQATWQAANRNTFSGVLEGTSSIGGYGSFGIFLGLTYNPGSLR